MDKICKPMNHIFNKRFNRYEGDLENMYLSIYGHQFDISHKFNAYIKCRLVHSIDDSVIEPDQIFVMTSDKGFVWFQPFTFFANLLVKDDTGIHVLLFVDISGGHTMKIVFDSTDWVMNYLDNSSLFKCIVYGPSGLMEYSTGIGYFENDIPYLKLYHHTKNEVKDLILGSNKMLASFWNIQGTKKLKNIHYCYFTSLDKILKPMDLNQIAMASDGIIRFCVDNFDLPFVSEEKDYSKYPDKILELKVYRESTVNRIGTLEFFIDSTILSPRHLWKHLPQNQLCYYEICMPYIYRIGVKPGEFIKFGNGVIKRTANVMVMDYQVIGLATNVDGLMAPNDEENTTFIFKMELLDKNMNIIDFWFNNTNTDQFSNKNVILQEFDR